MSLGYIEAIAEMVFCPTLFFALGAIFGITLSSYYFSRYLNLFNKKESQDKHRKN